MGKNFSENNPLNKLAGTNVQKSTSSLSKNNNLTVVEPIQQDFELKQEKVLEEQKRKVGRPKTKDVKNTCKNINVAVPITLLDKWEEIKIVHGNNLTAYITKLIERDVDTNYEHYKKIADSLKNI